MSSTSRKPIRFQVSQPYRPREGLSPLTRSSCTLVCFPSKEDPNFKSLRHLHEKEIQTTVAIESKGVQTEVRLPCNRWTQMQLQEVEEDDEMKLNISLDVLKRLQSAVEETATVDTLSDDWGTLSHLDKSPSFIRPQQTLFKEVVTRIPSLPEPEEEEEEEKTEGDEAAKIDIITLQRMKKKIMQIVDQHRVAKEEMPVERFYRLYKERLKEADLTKPNE